MSIKKKEIVFKLGDGTNFKSPYLNFKNSNKFPINNRPKTNWDVKIESKWVHAKWGYLYILVEVN